MNDPKNILIVGAGTAGKILKIDIEKNHPQLRVIGFVDDMLAGKPGILGTVDAIPELIQTYKINEIVIAIPTTEGALVRKILLTNLQNTIPIRIVPREQHVLTKNTVSYNGIKQVSSEDFLGRPIMKPDIAKQKRFYKGKTIFVTGGAGSIGSEIVRQLLDLEAKRVIIYDQSEHLIFALSHNLRARNTNPRRYLLIIGDILNRTRLNQAITRTKPNIVFHVAAYKHVSLMEENVSEAVKNNILGTKAVVDAAVQASIPRLTFISTDKVVHPQSVMGATKKIAEHYIQSIPRGKTKCTIVRFGNVINSQGSVLPLFEEQIRNQEHVTVTDKNMLRYFMSIREAAQLVIQATSLKNHGEIFVLNMGELISIYDAVRCLIRSKDMVPGDDIKIKFIGRRRGEKITEELYTSEEKKRMESIDNGKMWKLKNVESLDHDIEKLITTLSQANDAMNSEQSTMRILQKVFPSLRP